MVKCVRVAELPPKSDYLVMCHAVPLDHLEVGSDKIGIGVGLRKYIFRLIRSFLSQFFITLLITLLM